MKKAASELPWPMDATDAQRVEFLIALYGQLAARLAVEKKTKKRKL